MSFWSSNYSLQITASYNYTILKNIKRINQQTSISIGLISFKNYIQTLIQLFTLPIYIQQILPCLCHLQTLKDYFTYTNINKFTQLHTTLFSQKYIFRFPHLLNNISHQFMPNQNFQIIKTPPFKHQNFNLLLFYMSLKNKLLLISIQKQDQKANIATRVNLDLDLEGKLHNGSKKGAYLTSRLNNYKKLLEPIIKQNNQTKGQVLYDLRRETRRNSLQLLPKLHHYQFPIQQVPSKQLNSGNKKTKIKVLSMRNINNTKSNKRLKNIHQKDQIDHILLKMLSDQDIMHQKIQQTLQESPSQPLNKIMFKRNSVQPRIQGIFCAGNELSPTTLRRRIRQGMISRQLSPQRYQSMTISNSQTRRRTKKNKELKGWDTKNQQVDILQL